MPVRGNLEDPDIKGFTDESIRRGFIRKVYSILTVQLLVTAGSIAFFMFYEPAFQFVIEYYWLLYVAMGVLFVTLIALFCCGDVRRKVPMNYILLGLFTTAESFLLSVISTTYSSDIVLIAVGITSLLCISLTLFAFQTKIDFTLCGGFLFIALILLIVFGITVSLLSYFGHYNKILHLVYGSLGALLFSFYLIYDTQLMIGGEHKYTISPEEYIFAALTLYIDMINIFIFILSILGAAKK